MAASSDFMLWHNPLSDPQLAIEFTLFSVAHVISASDFGNIIVILKGTEKVATTAGEGIIISG